MEKAVVVFSGGQDSTTCLYWAKKRAKVVEAITFAYGQKHAIEIECAKTICQREGIKHTIVDISFLDQIVESALLSNGDVNETNEKGLPASFVPNRNQLFYTLAHAYAQKIDAHHLVLGVCETDFSGYPDCRDSFIKSIAHTSDIGSNSSIIPHTPLMFLNKAQTFKLAKDLGCLQDIIVLSHTCYNGDRSNLNSWGYGCDNCPACDLRKKGYEKFLIGNFA